MLSSVVAEIPKIIHQIWIGPKPPPKRFLATWQAQHPTWDYRFWTDDNLPPLKNQALYDALPTFHGKADVLRYELLHQFGGVYVDADSVCLMPLDQLLDVGADENFVAYEHEEARPGLIANGVMGCTPENRFTEMLIDELTARFDAFPSDAKSVPPWVYSGPMLVTEVVDAYRSAAKVRIYPSHYFYPEHLSGLAYTGDGPVFARQFWASTLNIYDKIIKD
jgi:mannosyltransferase OCH1-like enzyme